MLDMLIGSYNTLYKRAGEIFTDEETEGQGDLLSLGQE